MAINLLSEMFGGMLTAMEKEVMGSHLFTFFPTAVSIPLNI